MPLLLFLLLFSASCGAAQIEGDLTLHQLNHRAFKVTEGVPNDVHALAQTTDGTLWIGGHNGLTRFDGVRFVSYPGPADTPLQSTNIGSLIAAPDGGLWIGFRLGGVDFLQGGHLTHYGDLDNLPEGTIEQFAWDRDGSLWAASRVALFHFAGGRWHRVTREATFGTPYAVWVDQAGTLWMGTADGLFARPSGGGEFREVDRTIHFAAGRNSLTTSPDGRLWGVGSHELVRIDGPTQAHQDGRDDARQRAQHITERHGQGGEGNLGFRGERDTAAQHRRPLLGQAKQVGIPELQLVEDQELVIIRNAHPVTEPEQDQKVDCRNADCETRPDQVGGAVE